MKIESWVTRDYGSEGKGLCLSKSRLGNFVFHLLRMGGRITSTYTMNPEYPRCYVQMSVVLPEGKSQELQNITGVKLEKVSRLIPA